MSIRYFDENKQFILTTLAKKVCEDAQSQIKQDLEKLDILENPVLRLCSICGLFALRSCIVLLQY